VLPAALITWISAASRACRTNAIPPPRRHQGELSKTLFRISTMGEISDADIQRLLTAVARAL
jgi:aspartate aminotransferase-like enzyme